MAFLNDVTNELYLKIVYAGASGSGKTCNFQSLYKQTSIDVATRFFDLHTLPPSNAFFDFLPLSVGDRAAHSVRLHLYTLPSHALWNQLTYTLLSGIDGIVFVVDSRLRALHENTKQLRLLHSWLKNNQPDARNDIPLVFQYNHRDATDALPVEALREEFYSPTAGLTNAVAAQDVGVLETLDCIVEKVMSDIESKGQALRQAASSFN